MVLHAHLTKRNSQVAVDANGKIWMSYDDNVNAHVIRLGSDPEIEGRIVAVIKSIPVAQYL